jgi:hypothetical protein
MLAIPDTSDSSYKCCEVVSYEAGENFVKRGFMFRTHLILLGDQVMEDEKFRACSTNGVEEKCVQGFGGEV